jgi:hypothetical protein
MAGESARELAQRQRAKAERLTRSAALWERGAEGEEATAGALARLPSETWTVFHDEKWPGRPYANVDHIVVGPPGVFVIDSKNWSGRVEVKDGVLRQNGRSRDTSVAAAVEAGQAVAGLVPLLKPQLVHPTLCFVRDDELSGSARGVTVCSTSNLVPMLMSRPGVLASDQVAQLCLALNQGLQSAVVGRAQDVGSRGPMRPAKPANNSGSRRRDRSRSGLATLAAGALFLGVLVTRPEVLTGLADDFSGWFVDEVTSDTTKPEPKKKQRKNPANRQRDASQTNR